MEERIDSVIKLLEQSPKRNDSIKLIINIDSLRRIINEGYKEMNMEYGIRHTIETEEISKLDGEITNDGVVIYNYDEHLDVEEVEGFHFNNPVIFLKSNQYDERVLYENNEMKILKGFDGNTYCIKSECFAVGDKIYGVLPDYIVNYNGSISPLIGSAHENLERIKGKNIFDKIKYKRAIKIGWE